MSHKKIIISLLLLFLVSGIVAQKTVVLEKIRCQSFNVPLTTYLRDNEVKKNIASQLNNTLLQQRLLPLSDTTTVNIEFLPLGKEIKNVKPDFTDTDASHLHLYIDFFEVEPFSFFSQTANSYPPDSNMLKKAGTVLMIKAMLLRPDKTVAFNEELSIIISPANTPGIGTIYENGIVYGDLAITPKSFTELVKSAVAFLFNPKNESAVVEMSIKPAFFSDNYILPKTYKQPRLYVNTIKEVSTYNYQGKGEMIRFGQPVYNEILIKGKKALTYPGDLTKAIKSTWHYSSSDFVFLQQESRDVLRDKNYTLQLVTHVDPDPTYAPYGFIGEKFMFTNFLAGRFHYLFLEKDTLARFEINRSYTERENKYYPNHITNGFDSTVYHLPTTFVNETEVVDNYKISGTIGNNPFSIKCSGRTNTVKEFFLGDVLVCIAQGKFVPEKFVIFDASLSPELLNQLFIIGFNRFFE